MRFAVRWQERNFTMLGNKEGMVDLGFGSATFVRKVSDLVQFSCIYFGPGLPAMGKSPGKWIKTVLFGKKSSKTNILKGREKITNQREVVVAAKTSGANFASVPPVASQPDPSIVDRNEVEFENKGAESVSHDEGILLAASQDTEPQGSTPRDAPCDPEQIRKEQAATKAQAAFRGYLARRAFWALKGIIRLQALIRGHLVRRQALATLSSMLGVVKFQAVVRGRRVRHSDVGCEVKKKCVLVMPLDGKLADSVGVNMSTKMAKLSPNVFICQLLVASRTVMPLHLQYEPGDPNSVLNWLERWSRSYFWKPAPQPKKIVDLKPQKKQGNGHSVEPQTSRSKRTRRPANVESVSAQATSEFEKPKRSFRKVSSQPSEPVQENPQNELEKIVEKTVDTSGQDITEQHTNNAGEKMKKETTTASNLPDVETVPEPLAEKEPSDLLNDNQPTKDSKPPQESKCQNNIIPDEQTAIELKVVTDSTSKEESISTTNGGLSQKDELTGIDNQKSSRKASTPAKQERQENGSGVQSSPTLPSYMAATESAKAKLRAQGSPRIGQDVNEKSNVTRRHSLPSSTNKISSQSPRTQRLVQTGGKGGNKTERALLSSRDGNAKVTQAEWRSVGETVTGSIVV
ncbi:hypothetical protein FNV43_RR20529 [Rhamnella rubrinervis]|uniref:DUF4005 domain-containing protein n=1 Tax=Rhamnella rubrinervis TaxID=2594499 RepID=A0A8K0GUN3_9ROSA|nr:hypothetical protein FNV43_RR20529 [Rhamnella rubrinervis]